MSTSRNTVRNESTIDKVKDALHLNKNHATADTTGTHTSGTHAHNSNIANNGSRNTDNSRGPTSAAIGTTGYSGTHQTGTAGSLSNSTNAGPHNSNIANKADPRVDSDLDGRRNRHGAATGGIMGAYGSHATPGSGTAQNTAGPHNSDTLNKIDPRVDADRDGSNTIGGNKTYA